MATIVYYSGAVQGVGFRATAASIARRHPAVSGWVRNLPDGRVELLANGAPLSIESFLADIRARMEGYIESEEIGEHALDVPLTGFRIRY